MLTSLLLAAAFADDPVDPFTEPDEADLFRMEEQIITVASRYAQTVREAPAIVTVLTDDEIRQRGFRTLADVLRSLPGMYVSTSPEGRSLGWVRGVVAPDNNKILVMVDGVPWYDGVYTHAWIDEYLPLSMVKQVEIIKGPGSAIYGTNAFAGVVNIVTYRPEDLSGPYVRVTSGTGARFEFSAVAAERATLRGHELSAMAYARALSADGDGLDTTPRDRRNVTGTRPIRSINAGIDVRIDDMTVRFDHVDYRHTYLTLEQDDLLDVFLQSSDEYFLGYRDDFLTLRYDARIGRDLTVSPQLQLQQYDDPGQYAYVIGWTETTYDDGTSSIDMLSTLVETHKKTRRYAGSVDYQARLSAAHTNVGGVGLEGVQVLDLYDEQFDNGSHTPVRPRGFQAPSGETIFDVYAYTQHTWRALYWLELTAGLRADYNLQAEYFFPSPRLGVLLVPSPRVTTKLLYGRAFRAPTVRELLVEVQPDEDGYYAFTQGNLALVPEKIDTAEGEVTWQPAEPLTVRGAAFASVISDVIDKSIQQDQYTNRGSAVVLGAEAELALELGPVDGALSYAFTNGTTEGKRVYEFPPHMAHGRLTWSPVDRVYVTGMADWYGARPRSEWSPDAGLSDGPPFGLLHLAVATDTLSDRVRVDLSVRNILDTPHQTLVYIDDANAVSDGQPKYPNDIDGEGRMFVVGLEADL